MELYLVRAQFVIFKDRDHYWGSYLGVEQCGVGTCAWLGKIFSSHNLKIESVFKIEVCWHCVLSQYIQQPNLGPNLTSTHTHLRYVFISHYYYLSWRSLKGSSMLKLPEAQFTCPTQSGSLYGDCLSARCGARKRRCQKAILEQPTLRDLSSFFESLATNQAIFFYGIHTWNLTMIHSI